MALTAERNTRQAADIVRSPISYLVKGGVKVWKGSLVALNAGYAAPGATATGLVAVGRAMKTIDNTLGANGAIEVQVEEGMFYWANNSAGSDPVVAADVGGLCYIEDDQNVCHTATGKSAAGKVVRLDATLGVLVKTIL